MSKTLRTAALVVGAIALVATGVGAAASAGLFGSTVAAAGASAAATAAAASAAATAATITTIGTLASVAAGVLAIGSALTAKKPPSVGSPQEFSANPDAFIAYTIGRAMQAACIRFAGAEP